MSTQSARVLPSLSADTLGPPPPGGSLLGEGGLHQGRGVCNSAHVGPSPSYMACNEQDCVGGAERPFSPISHRDGPHVGRVAYPSPLGCTRPVAEQVSLPAGGNTEAYGMPVSALVLRHGPCGFNRLRWGQSVGTTGKP